MPSSELPIPKDEKCPKESCKQPPFSNRKVRGEQNWICRNGHNWPVEKKDDKTKDYINQVEIIGDKWKRAPKRDTGLIFTKPTWQGDPRVK